METLPISLRPKRLSRIVGHERLLERIKGHFRQGRIPKAWMFIGPKGCGKTTLARILGVTVQCRHQVEIGEPCDVCLEKAGDFGGEFDITEINAAKFNKKEELEAMLDGWDYNPNVGSRRRVYIIDELQEASGPAKTLLLKYFEDAPSTTIWIVCTTDPSKIPEALRSRCTTYTVPTLSEKGVKILVRRGLKYVKSELPVDALADALIEANVFVPRLVLVAVEKYTAGGSPEEAALVELSTEFDVRSLYSCLLVGDWNKAANQLREAKPEDVRGIRLWLARALSSMLMDESDFSRRTQIVADAVKAMATYYGDDAMALAALIGTLYQMCKNFREYRRR